MEVALFPLSRMVHLPGTNRPLNIFEPRYVDMIEDSLVNGRPIALCQGTTLAANSDPDSFMPIHHEHYLGVKRLCGIGLPILLKRNSDGTLLILLTGEGVVELQENIKSSSAYLIATAKPITQNSALDPHYHFMYLRMRELLMDKLTQLIVNEHECQRIRSELHSPTRLVAYFCELMIARFEIKEQLLKMSDINEKIAFLAQHYLNASGVSINPPDPQAPL